MYIEIFNEVRQVHINTTIFELFNFILNKHVEPQYTFPYVNVIQNFSTSFFWVFDDSVSLGLHVQRGLQYSALLSKAILALQATRQPMTDSNSFRAMRAEFQ